MSTLRAELPQQTGRVGAHALKVGRHCVGSHYDLFYGSSRSEMSVPRIQIELMCRTGAQAKQAMQQLRGLSLRPFLQQLMVRDAGDENSMEGRCELQE